MRKKFAFLIILLIIFFMTISCSLNFENGKNDDEPIYGYVIARYLGVENNDDQLSETVSEKGYYIIVMLDNYTNKAIDDDFKITLDIKYKEQYILEDAVSEYSVANRKPIRSKKSNTIAFKTNEFMYLKLKEINPFKKEFKVKIKNFEYKENVNWIKGWTNWLD